MSDDDRLGSTGAPLETLQRWELYLSEEFKDLLEEIYALKTESVDELIGRIREHAAGESAAHRPPWFGQIEQLVLSAEIDVDPVLYKADRILAQAAACRHPFICRCQRQLELFEERIRPALQIWDEFSYGTSSALAQRRSETRPIVRIGVGDPVCPGMSLA